MGLFGPKPERRAGFLTYWHGIQTTSRIKAASWPRFSRNGNQRESRFPDHSMKRIFQTLNRTPPPPFGKMAKNHALIEPCGQTKQPISLPTPQGGSKKTCVSFFTASGSHSRICTPNLGIHFFFATVPPLTQFYPFMNTNHETSGQGQ